MLEGFQEGACSDLMMEGSRRINSDRSKLDLSNETIKIYISVESYDEKTAENNRNCYVAEKRSFQTIKDLDPIFE